VPTPVPADISETVAGISPGFCLVLEARAGILQYLPHEPLIGESLTCYGEYLQLQLDLLLNFIAPEAIVMEIGAGVGAHAIALGQRVGRDGHLFLYESRPAMRRILQQNLATNQIVNVTVMKRALQGPRPANMARETETLDELQLERLNWLKLDAGVMALDLLQGAPDTLWRLRPLIFVAADNQQTLQQLDEHLKLFSYRNWRHEARLFNPANFYCRERDIFSGASALALLAIPEEIDVDVALDGCVEL
jgi:hypothetical protein